MHFYDMTILHVENDPLLAHVVKAAFQRFGFTGEMINAGSVIEAMHVLNDRMLKKRPVSLIISDMQLSDGTGLDLIREVKADPAFQPLPVIMLSQEIGIEVVNEAYALGASSYLPKIHATTNLLGSLQSMYHYWLENAMLPRTGSRDRLQEILERAIGLRNRTSEFYLRLARVVEGESDEAAFWLERALSEGNFSNLLAFFRNNVSEEDMPPDTIARFAEMQMKVKDALKTAEEHLQMVPAPVPAQAYEWSISLMEAVNEQVVAEVLGILFPKGAVATAALKARAAAHLNRLASHVLERTADAVLRRKAAALLDWSRRLRTENRQEK